jgi:hypothetical protein
MTGYEMSLLPLGQAKLEYSAREYERLAASYQANEPERAAACIEMAAINRAWKADSAIVLRFANNPKIQAAY